MSFTNDLLAGLAAQMETAGVALYREDFSSYAAGDTAVVLSLMPQSPDRCVALTAYSAVDAVESSWSTIPVQFRFRGNVSDPTDVTNFADDVFQAIHGLTNLTFGSAHLVQILRKSTVPLGQDDSRRWQRSDNYYADINAPTTARRPY